MASARRRALALALLVGGRVFAAMKRSLGLGEWARRGFGALVLAAVAAIALGADTGVLARLSLANTDKWEQALLEKFALAPSQGGSNDNSSVVMAPGEDATMMAGGGAMMMKSGASADAAKGARGAAFAGACRSRASRRR